MNQILSVEPIQNKKRGGYRTSLHSIVVVFSVFLMIFGIGLTGTGAYSFYKNNYGTSNEDVLPTSSTKPLITVERINSNTINIVATHDKEISNITYKINDEEPVIVNGENKQEIQKEVKLSSGTSSINITAQDINGISASYETSIQVEQKPTITLEQVENKIQATIESEINIDYVVYYWDDEEANAEPYTVNDVKNVTLIDVKEGTHTLNVKAVDIQGDTETISQKIIGDNKPELKVTTDGQKFIIRASDDEGLSKVEITLNTNETITEEINNSEYTKNVDLENGENKLTVKIYNKNGISETAKVKFTKE